MYSNNFFKIVVAFLRLMKGTHIKMKSMIDIIEGHNISVSFQSLPPFSLTVKLLANLPNTPYIARKH